MERFDCRVGKVPGISRTRAVIDFSSDEILNRVNLDLHNRAQPNHRTPKVAYL